MSDSLSKMKNEIENHENNISEERERHENEVIKIWENCIISDLVKKSKEVKNKRRKIKDNLDDIEKILKDFINDSVTGNRLTIYENEMGSPYNITIRDNNFYYYNTSREAKLSHLFGNNKNLYRLMKNISNQSRRSKLINIIRILRSNDRIFGHKNNFSEINYNYEVINNQLVIFDIYKNNIYTGSKENFEDVSSVIDDIKSNSVIHIPNTEMINLMSLERDIKSKRTNFYKRYKKAFSLKTEIKYIIEKTNEKFVQLNSDIIRIYDKISNLISKYLVSKKI